MKAHFPFLEALGEKIIVVATLITMVFWMYPGTLEAVKVAQGAEAKPEALVFEIDPNKQLSQTNIEQNQLSFEELKLSSSDYHLETLLKEYLQKRGSPLADCTTVLLEEAPKNWEKILALANAESGLGKRYPKQTANMWGVGGAKLWDFGETACDGVRGMNDFLNNYPKRGTKYSDMTIEQMNGLYKQPARAHWVNNNKFILNILAEFKSEARELALAHSKTVAVANVSVELVK